MPVFLRGLISLLRGASKGGNHLIILMELSWNVGNPVYFFTLKKVIG